MTVSQMAKLIGKVALLKDPSCKGWAVQVGIKDIRTVFGRTDALVVPALGTGERWVSLDSLTYEQ